MVETKLTIDVKNADVPILLLRKSMYIPAKIRMYIRSHVCVEIKNE